MLFILSNLSHESGLHDFYSPRIKSPRYAVLPDLFYLHVQVGILSFALHVPWPNERGAYAPQTKWDSLIISVGKIKTGKHVHRRDTLYIYFTTKRSFYQQFFSIVTKT